MKKIFLTLGWFSLFCFYGENCFAMDNIDFANLTLSLKPNQYLVCPKHYCKKAKPHEISPVFAVSSDKLYLSWTKVINSEKRIEKRGVDQTNHTYYYVQRSALLRFPDFIAVQIIPIDKSHSTLAIYSQSKYGYSDFGVNKKRVQRLLRKLQDKI